MEKHAGAIIEKAVRRSGISITELARKMSVDRRTLYFWFKQAVLKPLIIVKVGEALNVDLSNEFSGIMKNNWRNEAAGYNEGREDESVMYWKERYILLLEKYNYLLQESLERDQYDISK